jgi:hypothetical protein
MVDFVKCGDAIEIGSRSCVVSYKYCGDRNFRNNNSERLCYDKQ